MTTVFREALRNATIFESDIEVLGKARDEPTAIHLAGSYKPDVILIGPFVPAETGLA